MKTYEALLLAVACTFAGPIAMAGKSPAGPWDDPAARASETRGLGYDYRRNVGGTGMRQRANPAEQRPVPSYPAEQPARPQRPPRPLAPEPPQGPGPGYRGNPAWFPGTPAPYRGRGWGYPRPGRQGYGYPGYRGRGGSPYPGHRQYGNPPGTPAAPRGGE